MGGKNSFFQQMFRRPENWIIPGSSYLVDALKNKGGGGNGTPVAFGGTGLTPTTPPPAPTVAAAGETADQLEAKKRKAAGRESTVLTAGLGSGMNTTYSVNKPTLGA